MAGWKPRHGGSREDIRACEMIREHQPRQKIRTRQLQGMKEIEIYKSPDNKIELQVNLENETVWLSQKQMAELFGKDSDTIGLYLKNIYSEQELTIKSTTEFFSVVQTEGKRKVNRNIKYFNLDALAGVPSTLKDISYSECPGPDSSGPRRFT